MHVPLGRRDVCVSQPPAGVLDSFLPANLRAAFVTRKVQHQITRKAGQIPEAGIRPAEILDGPRLACRREENRPGFSFPDGLTQQFSEFPANGDAPGLPGLRSGRLAKFARARPALPEGRIDQPEFRRRPRQMASVSAAVGTRSR